MALLRRVDFHAHVVIDSEAGGSDNPKYIIIEKIDKYLPL